MSHFPTTTSVFVMGTLEVKWGGKKKRGGEHLKTTDRSDNLSHLIDQGD